MSQSLWSRDYFLMVVNALAEGGAVVEIPLEQGLFFKL